MCVSVCRTGSGKSRRRIFSIALLNKRPNLLFSIELDRIILQNRKTKRKLIQSEITHNYINSQRNPRHTFQRDRYSVLYFILSCFILFIFASLFTKIRLRARALWKVQNYDIYLFRSSEKASENSSTIVRERYIQYWELLFSLIDKCYINYSDQSKSSVSDSAVSKCLPNLCTQSFTSRGQWSAGERFSAGFTSRVPKQVQRFFL